MHGDGVAEVAFEELASPAIWKPSPGGVVLSWVSSGKQRFGLSGSSFEGTSQTGPELTLEVVDAAGSFSATG